MKAWLIPISLCLAASPAYADQCAWIDEAAALKAQRILKSSPKFIEYCEPCDETAPGTPQVAKTVDVNDAGDGNYKEVSINGKAIDLAYVFVKTSDARYENLASLAGCPATGVSPSLTIEAETRTGVMITADNDPPAQGMTPVSEVPSFGERAVPPPVAPPLQQVYVYKTTTHEIAWLPIALAAAGGFVSGSALLILLIVMRRRHALRPRAVNLTAPKE